MDQYGIGDVMSSEQSRANAEMTADSIRRALAQQQAYGSGQLLGAHQVGAPQPLTLARALGALDGLNKRLAEATEKAMRLATLIGGPVPASGGGQGATVNKPDKPSAMAVLNNEIVVAHFRVDALTYAIEAMSRSLGAIDG